MRIGITMGDPFGIGPQIVVQALALLSSRIPVDFVVFGDKTIVQRACRFSRVPLAFTSFQYGKAEDASVLPRLVMVHIPFSEKKKEGADNATRGNGLFCLQMLKEATEWALAHKVDGIVTAPVNKTALFRAGFKGGGHTEYFAELTHTKKVLMMLVGGGFRVGLVTRHIPLRTVSLALTAGSIIDTIELARKGLVDFFGIRQPKIWIAGPNPHAGEQGKIGDEEIKVITPAICACKKQGIDVEGPIPADSLFRMYQNAKVDAAICMYHDQGLSVLKAFAKNKGVNITIGLPFPRTSPDHGTAYDKAWKGTADPTSMIEAIKQCIQMVKISRFQK